LGNALSGAIISDPGDIVLKIYLNSHCEITLGEPEVKWKYLLGIAAAFAVGYVSFYPLPRRLLFFQQVILS
jgi:hypothetical protein